MPTGAVPRHDGGVSVSEVRVPADVLVHLRRARDRMDREYADPVDLELLGRTAGISKWHFHRLFARAYGVTPAAYLSERRIERAQDLLRATTLSVTEVCHAVGFASLGSFSTRFRQLVGESPREFQQRWGADAPRIPGCFVLMAGLVEKTASEEKHAGPDRG